MCGIVSFVGQGPAVMPIRDALKRLEYRGYDSAGMATPERGRLAVARTAHRSARAHSNANANCDIRLHWEVQAATD